MIEVVLLGGDRVAKALQSKCKTEGVDCVVTERPNGQVVLQFNEDVEARIAKIVPEAYASL